MVRAFRNQCYLVRDNFIRRILHLSGFPKALIAFNVEVLEKEGVDVAATMRKMGYIIDHKDPHEIADEKIK